MKNNQEQKEKKFAMISRWETSGIRQKQFCVGENVSMNNFQYWLKRYRKRDEKKTGKFIKIQSPEKNIPPAGVFTEVIFANGNRIKFYNAVEIPQLKQLTR